MSFEHESAMLAAPATTATFSEYFPIWEEKKRKTTTTSSTTTTAVVDTFFELQPDELVNQVLGYCPDASLCAWRGTHNRRLRALAEAILQERSRAQLPMEFTKNGKSLGNHFMARLAVVDAWSYASKIELSATAMAAGDYFATDFDFDHDEAQRFLLSQGRYGAWDDGDSDDGGILNNEYALELQISLDELNDRVYHAMKKLSLCFNHMQFASLLPRHEILALKHAVFNLMLQGRSFRYGVAKCTCHEETTALRLKTVYTKNVHALMFLTADNRQVELALFDQRATCIDQSIHK